MKNYGGDLDNVYAPTVDEMTNQYRNSQDKVNEFITKRMVMEMDDHLEPQSLTSVIGIYIKWYNSNVSKITHYAADVKKNLEDSILMKYVEVFKYGTFLKKYYRILDIGDQISADTQTFKEFHKIKKPQTATNIHEYKPETVDEFYERFIEECKELDADYIEEQEYQNRNRFRQMYSEESLSKKKMERQQSAKFKSFQVSSRICRFSISNSAISTMSNSLGFNFTNSSKSRIKF